MRPLNNGAIDPQHFAADSLERLKVCHPQRSKDEVQQAPILNAKRDQVLVMPERPASFECECCFEASPAVGVFRFDDANWDDDVRGLDVIANVCA
jgi:hypothetical protein